MSLKGTPRVKTTNQSAKSAKRKRTVFLCCMLVFPLLHFLIFFVYINFSTIWMCFNRLNFLTGEYRFVGFDNFADLIRDIGSRQVLRRSITNSLWLFPITNGILLPLSVLSAYLLFRKVPLHRAFRVIFFLPSIISIVIMTMVFSFMFDSSFGVFNGFLQALGLGQFQRTWFGDPRTDMAMVFIYCIWVGIGYNVVLLNGAITRISEDVIEYGRLEGIPMWRELFQVIIPMIWPTISTVFVLGTTSSFTLFLQPKLLTGGGTNGSSSTIALVIVEMTKAASYEQAATAGVFFAIIGVIVVMTVKAVLDKIGSAVEY